MAKNNMPNNRGFAAMDEVRQREIAARGGREAHRQGHAHEFNSLEARAAGRLGGRVVSRDREHMAEIGARGGHAHAASRRLGEAGHGAIHDPPSPSHNPGGADNMHVRSGQEEVDKVQEATARPAPQG